MRPAPRILASWSAGLVMAAFASASAAVPSAVVDLDGRAVDPLGASRAIASVLVFTRTDCPISNRYAPELRRLSDRFAARGVAFWLVYPDRDEAVDAIRRHHRAFGSRFAVVRDPEHALVRLTGATVTPEAAVFVRDAAGPQMRYRGRIDDRAVEFGRTRAAPTRRDLAEILEALAAGRGAGPRTTAAIGCFIPDLP